MSVVVVFRSCAFNARVLDDGAHDAVVLGHVLALDRQCVRTPVVLLLHGARTQAQGVVVDHVACVWVQHLDAFARFAFRSSVTLVLTPTAVVFAVVDTAVVFAVDAVVYAVVVVTVRVSTVVDISCEGRARRLVVV